MTALWYPDAKKEEMTNADRFLGGPARGVLHTTEGSSYAGACQIYRLKSCAPHFTVEGRDVYQHIPINRAARALESLSGGVETNRWSAIQIEVVGRAANPNWPPETIESTRLLMAWIEAQTGIEPRAPRFIASSAAYGRNAPQRMAPDVWKQWNGWCGHQHVPENKHWDPGAAPMIALLTRERLTPENPRPQGAPMANSPFCALLVHPNGGYLEIGEDGGVFSWGEPPAPFFGSLGGTALNAAISDADWTPDHDGYWLVGEDGGVFNFGKAGFFGSISGQTLNKPIIGIKGTPSGQGYFLIAQDGGIFAFGDARYRGNAIWGG
jgi:hypothetical protein